MLAPHPGWPWVVHTACVTFGEAGFFELGTDGPTVILVGVDGSPTSLRAGAYAAGLARRQRARLVVVYVGPVASMAAAMPGAAGAVAVAQEEAFDETCEDLRRQIEGQAQERGIAVTFVARRGDPFSELRRVAGEVRAEAVVVGASAKAGHRIVGSVAVRLVRAGGWPVTVVP
jgi:nucleotide-binding universal stress UspA family protein